MRQKFLDFLYSYGLMTLGCVLIFIASASIKTGHYPLLKFPASEMVESAQIDAVRAERGGDAIMEELPPARPIIPLAKDKSEFAGKLTAASVFVVDDNTDTVLFEKNSDVARPLASITKLMTMIILSELPMRWTSSTVVEEIDCDTSSHHINPGEKYTLDDLWNIALVGSSNSAIAVLVRESGILPENFVVLMNKKAEELNLASAKFVEPTGLNAGNIADARDISALLKEALKYDKINKTMHIGEYYAQPLNQTKKRRVWSTNWLLTNWIPNKFKAENICGKTGYIIDSGYNLAVRLSNNDGRAVRAVVLGAESNEARFIEARDLAEWALEHYLWPEDEGYDGLVE